MTTFLDNECSYFGPIYDNTLFTAKPEGPMLAVDKANFVFENAWPKACADVPTQLLKPQLRVTAGWYPWCRNKINDLHSLTPAF